MRWWMACVLAGCFSLPASAGELEVRPDRPRVIGALPAAAVAAQMYNRRDAFTLCAEKVGGALHRVVLRFQLDEQGVARGVRTEADAEIQDEHRTCFEEVVTDSPFPAPEKGRASITVALDVVAT
jgi:hypothetical protein